MNEPVEVNFTEQITAESTVEDLKIILSQAELRNKALNDNADSLYKKSVTFLTLSITALTGLAVYLSDKPPTFTSKYFICWELVLLLCVVCTKLKDIIFMSEYYGVGACPNTLLHQDFYENLDNKRPEWYIMQRLIIDYQIRVEKNNEQNKSRSSILRDSINWLYWAPGVIIITYLLFLIFSA